MENIRELLEIKLLSQTFKKDPGLLLTLDAARQIARLYTTIESGISVLSDMKTKRSYIYYGAMAGKLGLSRQEEEINSIWEDELLSLIHTQDLQKKYRLEIRFFKYLNSLPVVDRAGYEVIAKLRMRGADGKNMLVRHRVIYMSSSEDGSIMFVLCLYNLIYDYPGFDSPDGLIINTQTGAIIDEGQDQISELLSLREKEIIQLIKLGLRSKEIADKLSLSIHTVNRHRQNIFQKLNVSNAMEACRMTDAIGLVLPGKQM
ncbi:MAG: LuxR family transcriptional regulator [Pedobacter sp.]|nr:MAG: LuxR family transcriptional regulator [Pedobacter sp.]